MKVNQRFNNGITLIALVVTIIILLVLSGISISMLSGENGILSKAITAKSETEVSKSEEELKLKMMDYQIDAVSGKSVGLKEYLESIDGIEIIKEDANSGCEEIKYNDEIYVISDKGTVNKIEKSKNLVKNGYLEYKDNTNFPSWNYTEEKYLTNTTDTRIYIYSSEYIPVDTSKKYYQAITMKTDNLNAKYYVGIQEYDIDKKAIGPIICI